MTLPQNNTKFVDALELMFFAYRDFISDPDEILAVHGFGRAHHRVLHFVGGAPGLSVADLLDILRVSKQSLARILRDLIDTDHMTQKIGEQDRRQRLLHLTPKGHELHQQLIAPQIQRFSNMLYRLDDKTFQNWKKVMYHIIDEAEREKVETLIANAHYAVYK